MDYSDSLDQFKKDLSRIFATPYNKLRTAVNTVAKKINIKPQNQQRNTLTNYLVGIAREKFTARNKEISERRQTAIKYSSVLGSLRQVLPAAEMEILKPSGIRLYRHEQDAEINLLFNAANVFNENVTMPRAREGVYIVRANTIAIIRGLFPDGADEMYMQRFFNTVFRDWLIENRINTFAANQAANKLLFVQRYNENWATPLWSAWREHNQRDFIIKDTIKPRMHWLAYIFNIGSGAGFNTDNVEFHLSFVADRRFDPITYERVGYAFYNPVGEKNCLVKIIEPYVSPAKKDAFDEMTRHLIHKNNEPAFIDANFINALGKLLEVKISLYSPYGALINKPTQVLGRQGNKKNFKIIVKDRHAHVFRPQTISKVEYINTYEDIAALGATKNIAAVIDTRDTFTQGNIAGTPFDYFRVPTDNTATDKRPLSAVITLDGYGESAVATIHKYIRPSSITGIEADDADRSLFAKTNPSSIFLHHFVRKHGITTPPKFVRELAALAGTPFSTATYIETTKNTNLIEIDHNASYASFQFSKYYNGFPIGNFVKAAGPPRIVEDAELRPAFVEVRYMYLRSDESRYAANYNDGLKKLRGDFRVITYPEYLRWSEMYHIDVINTTYATFKHCDLQNDLDEVKQRMRDLVGTPTEEDIMNDIYDVVPLYIKQMRNMFTGKLIQGGLYEYGSTKVITTNDKTEFEIMVAEITRETGQPPQSEIYVSPYGVSTYRITININHVSHKYPHIYAYITALSRLAILDKIAELRTNIYATIARVHVDAIYVTCPRQINQTRIREREYIDMILAEIPGMTQRGQEPRPHDWKIGVGKSYEQKISDDKPLVFSEPDHIQQVDTPYPIHRMVCVEGPGGCGKTYNALRYMRNESEGRALYIAPTIILRDEIRDTLEALGKDRDDCICDAKILYLLSTDTRIPKYRELMNKIENVYTHFIIDEAFKIDGKSLEALIKLADRHKKNVIMLGDQKQIRTAIGGLEVDEKKLKEWNTMFFTDPRLERSQDKPMRHSYEWGTFLDSLREMTSRQMIETLMASNEFGPTNPNGVKIIYKEETTDNRYKFFADEARTNEIQLDNAALAFCGNWRTIATLNQMLINSNRVVRLTHIKKWRVLAYADNLKPFIWNKSAFGEQMPKKKRYFIDHAYTIDSQQGRTCENPIQYIDCNTMYDRHGCIYTALTRARRPSQITLVL